MKSIIAISAGAAIGAVLRWALGLRLNALFPALPPGTLAANLIGGYVIGVAMAYFATTPAIPSEWRLLVITVCDSAAKEACPYWPGGPVQVHWGFADPSNAPGGDDARRAAFELTRQAIGYRMLQLLQLPLETLDDAALRVQLQDIARR